MKNTYEGYCSWCGRLVKPNQGYIQSIGSLDPETKKLFTGANYKGKWLIRCKKCVGVPNQELSDKLEYDRLVKKKEALLSGLQPVIQVCPICYKIDVSKDDGYDCLTFKEWQYNQSLNQ